MEGNIKKITTIIVLLIILCFARITYAYSSIVKENVVLSETECNKIYNEIQNQLIKGLW